MRIERKEGRVHRVAFEERAPELRSESMWALRVAGYLIAEMAAAMMLLSLTQFVPDVFGTGFGDGALSGAETLFWVAFLGVSSVAGVFFYSLLAPFHGRVRVEIDAGKDAVRVFHNGRCSETVKLSDVRKIETCRSPAVGDYLKGIHMPMPFWFFPAWFVPGMSHESSLRRLGVTEIVYLIVGKGESERRVEVGAFMPHGGHAIWDAQDAAQAIDEVLWEVACT